MPLLQTKLHIPHLRWEFVRRSQLIDLLKTHQHKKLTLITAPAGFGKTTLATCWLTQQNSPVAWVSLDESDNDPIRFFLYVITALNRASAAGIGQKALDLLESSDPVSHNTLLAYLINDLVQLDSNLILALDDYHLIHTGKIHDALAFLLDNQPTQLHLVLISRAEPPLPLARLRSKHQLAELQTVDLRFTRAETELFLNQTMHLGLSNQQISELETQTEGWVTGLQLVALTIKNAGDAGKLIDHISGSNRYIADYLIDEVLSRQPKDLEQFLLQTSILEQMNAGLCNVLTGRDDSQLLLEALEKSNLFVIPLDNTRTWYRYHHLFAELLCHRLIDQLPDQVESLHQRAAQWFFDQEMIEEAIEHSLKAKDYGVVTEYLQAIIDDEILAKGRFKTYLGWLDRIPDPYLVDYPKLLLYQVFQLWEMQDLDNFQPRLNLVEKLLGPSPSDAANLDGQTAAYHGILAIIKGVVNCGNFATKQASAFFARALRLLPDELTFWRTLALGATGFCYRVEGNYSEAGKYFSQVIELATRSNLILLCFMYSIAQALVYLAQGRLREAIEAGQIPLSLDGRQGYNIPFAGLAYSVMGILLYLSGDLSAAEKQVTRGLELVTRDGDVYYIADGHFTLAQIRIAQGDIASALDLMEQMMTQINALRPPQSGLIVARAYQAHIRIACHRLTAVKQWVANPGSEQLVANQFPDILGESYFGVYCTVHESFKSYIEFINLTVAWFEFATNNAWEAIKILDALLDGIVHEDRIFFRIRVQILKALALQKAGEDDEAVAILLTAINLVAPEPFFQLFVNEGKPMLELLAKAKNSLEENAGAAAGNGPIPVFIDEILARMAETQPAPPQNSAEPSAFELTPRETEVLTYLAEGVSYAEIAKKLMVSKNTVKTHLKRVYSKLEVANRLQAINKAKELELLG